MHLSFVSALLAAAAALPCEVAFRFDGETKPSAVRVGLARWQDPSESQLSVETVLDKLDRPSGIAVHPKSGQVFVAESGAGRVVRLVDGKTEEVIVDFPESEIGVGSGTFTGGPSSIDFLDEKTLVAGTVDANGLAELRFYSVPADEIMNAQDPVRIARPRSEESLTPLTRMLGIASTTRGMFVCTSGDAANGWIVKLESGGARADEMTRFIATTTATGITSPYDVVISPDGFLAVAQLGILSETNDSRLAFFDEQTAALKADFEMGLANVVALAYGPLGGRLFALELGAEGGSEAAGAGLYKLVGRENNTKCEAISMMVLQRPTDMAFDAQGNLFVTLLGDGTQSGSVIKISGLDIAPTSSAPNSQTSDSR